jgi:hypothetical protein
MTPEEAGAGIERVEVDVNAILAFEREIQFSILGFNLCREVASWVAVAACAIPSRRQWSRNEAVLAGHVVRLFKLLRSFLDQIKAERADIMWVVLRMTSECAINLRFLTAGGERVIEDYVRYSLQREWHLLDEIEANIAERGGDELPIEGRMKRSIMRTFNRSEVDHRNPPARPIRHWGGMDLRRRASSLGLERAYLAVFSGPSENVHGNWGDLLRHHLKWTEHGFEPNIESSPMKRPQPFFALGTIAATAVIDYLQQVDGVLLSDAITRLKDLVDRMRVADELHEGYLQKRSSRRSRRVVRSHDRRSAEWSSITRGG